MKLTAPPIVNEYDIERRVALEVMGLPAVEWGSRTRCPYCEQVGRWCGGRTWCCNCEEWYYHPYKNYRDSLNDAMEVIDKMKELGHEIEIHGAAGWWVTFEPKTFRRAASAGPSLPEAICRAALTAMEQKS